MTRMRTRRSIALSVTAAIALATASTALAHHSFAMFDASTEIVLDGTVREFRWSNPHCWIRLTVMEKGQSVEYAIESPSPSQLSRSGWTASSLKPGDRVKITIQPLRDGTKGGSFVRGLLPNGRTLTLAG